MFIHYPLYYLLRVSKLDKCRRCPAFLNGKVLLQELAPAMKRKSLSATYHLLWRVILSNPCEKAR